MSTVAPPSRSTKTAANAAASRSGGAAGAKFEKFIDERIAEACRALWWAEIVRTLLRLVLAGLAVLGLWLLVDHWIYSPSVLVRTVLASALVIAAGVYLGKFAVPLMRSSVRPEYAARAMERDLPELRQSLTSYVTLRENGRNPDLRSRVIRTVGSSTAARLKTHQELPAEATGTMRLWIATAIALALLAAYAVASPKNAFQSAARLAAPLASIDAPRRVSIENVTPGDTDAIAGRTVEITAAVKGLREDETVTGSWTLPGGTESTSLQYDPDLRAYRGQIDLPHSVAGIIPYRIEAGDAVAGPFELSVQDVPVVALQSIQYQPPKYTGRQPYTSSSGAIAAIDGTQVTVRAKVNRPVAKAKLEFNPRPIGDQVRATAGASEMSIDDGTSLSATFRLRSASGRSAAVEPESYRIKVWDDTQQSNPEPIIYPIRVIADLPPEVAITLPTQTPSDVDIQSQQIIEVHAADPDFGLSEVALEIYSGIDLIARPELWPPREAGDAAAVDGSADRSRGTRVLEFAFRPSRYDLQINDKVQIVAVATDNRKIDELPGVEPNVVKTDPIELKITPGDPNAPATSADSTSENGERQSGANEQSSAASDSSQSPSEDQQGESGQQGSGSGGKGEGQQQAGDSESGQSGGQGGSSQDSAGQESSAQDAANQDSANQDSANQDSANQDSASGGSENPSPQGSGGSSDDSGESNSQGNETDSQKGGSSGESAGGSQQNSASEATQSEGAQSEGAQSEGPQPQAAPQAGSQDSPSDSQSADGAPQGSNAPQGSSGGGQNDVAKPPPSHDGETFERIKDYLDKKRQEQSASQQGDSQQEGAKPRDAQQGAQQSQQGADQSQQGAEQSNSGDSASPKPSGEPAEGTEPRRPEGEASQETAQSQSSPDSMPNPDPSTREPGTSESAADSASDSAAGEQSESSPSSDSPSSDSPSSDSATPESDGQRAEAQPQGSGNETQDPSPEQSEGAETSSTDNTDDRSAEGQSGDSPATDNPSGESGSEGSNDPSGESGQQDGRQDDGQKASPSSEASEGDQGASAADKGNESSSEGTSDRGGANQDKSDQRGQRNAARDNGEQGDASQGGASASPNESGRSPAEGGSPADAQRAGDQNVSGDASGASPGAQGRPTSGEGQATSGQGDAAETSPPPAEPNLEYTREATDMVLDYLEETRESPDRELLDELNWDEQDLQRFTERWQKLRETAKQPAVDPAERQDLQQALESLGLRPDNGAAPTQAEKADTLRSLRDAGNRRPPPPAFRDAFDAFRRAVGE